jgi:hypothetical protein
MVDSTSTSAAALCIRKSCTLWRRCKCIAIECELYLTNSTPGTRNEPPSWSWSWPSNRGMLLSHSPKFAILSAHLGCIHSVITTLPYPCEQGYDTTDC